MVLKMDVGTVRMKLKKEHLISNQIAQDLEYRKLNKGFSRQEAELSI